jgi:recombination protein RecR
MSKYPQAINTLVAFFRKLPGVGIKTAERYAFQLLDWKKNSLHDFSELLKNIKEIITTCKECGCFIENNICQFCEHSQRETNTICIISSPKDVYPIEETRVYKGLYHVIGGLLSPMEGKSPQDLQIETIKQRVIKHSVQDIIIALDSTLEGDATALYLKEELKDMQIRVSRPAMGIPMGSSLEYIDGGTLARAIVGRQNF